MEEKICSFFGHRDIEITDALYEKAFDEIIRALDAGCCVFYFGGYGAFDKLCYSIVTKIKEENPARQIKRIYCVSQERYLHKNTRYCNRDDYEECIYLMPKFDGWYKSIYFRNCAMIDRSDFIIFYAEKSEGSGAYKAYKYARMKKKSIVNIF